MPHPTRQSIRGPEDECFVAPWTQLDYHQPKSPGLRPRTTVAEYRTCFAEAEGNVRLQRKAESQAEMNKLAQEDLEDGERAQREKSIMERAKTPSLAFNKVPRRTLISRIGTCDRDGYKNFPPQEYKMMETCGPATTPGLSPTKYEQNPRTFKVRNCSPKRYKPFSGWKDAYRGPPHAPNASNCGLQPRGPYVDGGLEAMNRRDARAASKKSLDGNLTFPLPQEVINIVYYIFI